MQEKGKGGEKKKKETFILFTQSLIGLLHLVDTECSHLLHSARFVVMFVMRLQGNSYLPAPSRCCIYKMGTLGLLSKSGPFDKTKKMI